MRHIIRLFDKAPAAIREDRAEPVSDKQMNDPCDAFRDARSCPNFDSMQRSRYSEKQKQTGEQAKNEHLQANLSAAQKKIAELEAERDALKLQAQIRAGELLAIKEAVDKLRENAAGILQQLTAERQRRESAEAVAKPFAFGDPILEQILFDGLPDDAPGTITVKRGDFRRLRQHFTRYPNASDSEGVNNDES